MRNLVLVMAVLLLAGCQKPVERSATVYADEKPSAPASGAAAPAADAAADAAPAAAPKVPSPAMANSAPAEAPMQARPSDGAAAPSGPITPQAPAGAPMMAYSYNYGLEADPWKVRGLEAKQEHDCQQAGPALCVVTGSSVNEEGKDRVSAQLSLRAAPAWLAKFKAGLAKDVDDAGGKVVHQAVTSEDLSRQIVDSEAALRAKTTLRDRLQQILATRQGDVSDLLEVETSLSNVQGEIDTTNSELAMMRQRVATSEVEITYESAGVLAPQGVFSPLAHAVGDFLGIVVVTLAAMVRLVAWLLPWAAVLGAIFWVFRKRLPKLRWPFGRKAKPAPDKQTV